VGVLRRASTRLVRAGLGPQGSDRPTRSGQPPIRPGCAPRAGMPPAHGRGHPPDPGVRAGVASEGLVLMACGAAVWLVDAEDSGGSVLAPVQQGARHNEPAHVHDRTADPANGPTAASTVPLMWYAKVDMLNAPVS
jgi:hypothetical protein